MQSKPRYSILTKIVGVLMVLFTISGFYVLVSYEDISLLFLWHLAYMAFIGMGAVFNLLDSGKNDFSKYSCVSYVISLILRILFDLMITQTAHWGLLIILTAASLISILRYISVSKGNRKRRKAMRKKLSEPTNTMITNPYTSAVNTSQSKCRVGIMRQAKVSGGGSAFTIYVDGVETTKIKNGGMTRLLLTPGRHTLAFGGMGLKVSGSITLDLTPENDVNVMCYAKGSGIESVLTDVDVCALANSNQSIQKQSGGNGCLIAFIIVFLLFALGIISIKFTVFFVPVG